MDMDINVHQTFKHTYTQTQTTIDRCLCSTEITPKFVHCSLWTQVCMHKEMADWQRLKNEGHRFLWFAVRMGNSKQPQPRRNMSYEMEMGTASREDLALSGDDLMISIPSASPCWSCWFWAGSDWCAGPCTWAGCWCHMAPILSVPVELREKGIVRITKQGNRTQKNIYNYR